MRATVFVGAPRGHPGATYLSGNRLTKSHSADAGSSSVAYTYGLYDQLLTETGTGAIAYTTTYGHPDGSGHIVGGYDLNGSLLEKHRTGASAEDDTYTYDLRNRLSTSNETASGTITAATFTYTPTGDRLSETVTVNNGTPTTTNYLTDGDNPTGYSQVLEQSATAGGAPSTTYLLGGAVLGQANAAGAISYLATDGHGNTRFLTDSTGAVAPAGGGATYLDYDAFGNALGFDASHNPISYDPKTAATAVLYTGQQFDAGVGLYNLRARDYDPAVGRFTARDAVAPGVGDATDADLYVYGGSSPPNMADPSGNDAALDVVAAAGIANSINAIEFTAFSAAFETVRGLERGLSGEQITTNFLIGQAIGVGLVAVGFGLGTAWGALRDGSLLATDAAEGSGGLSRLSVEAADAVAEADVELNAIFGGRGALPEWASVRPSPQTARNFEDLAKQLGITIRFNSAVESPVTRAYGQTAEIVFPGRTLRDSPLVDVLDEFGHAVRVVQGEPTIGRGSGSVLEVLHHADIFGEWSLSNLLTDSEQEVAQEAEIFLRSLAKRIGG